VNLFSSWKIPQDCVLNLLYSWKILMILFGIYTPHGRYLKMCLPLPGESSSLRHVTAGPLGLCWFSSWWWTLCIARLKKTIISFVYNATEKMLLLWIKYHQTCRDAKTVLKGTVARDFWPLVFFTNKSHLGLWLTG
jgi:hypothetical protein